MLIAYAVPDTQLPRVPARGATPAHHPYCVMVYDATVAAYRRTVANIRTKRAAARIARAIARGEDPAAATFNVLG